MSLKTDAIAVGIVGVILLAAGWYAAKKLKAVADVALPYINPADEQNVVNQAANGFFQAVTGSTTTIGGAIYETVETVRLAPQAFWDRIAKVDADIKKYADPEDPYGWQI